MCHQLNRNSVFVTPYIAESGKPLQMDSFFIEYAGELRIFVLRRRIEFYRNTANGFSK